MNGGRGAVWFAVDTELGRPVVLKRTLAEDNSRAAFDELLAEARALAKFSHPHVVTLYGAERAGWGPKATFWLVMEQVTGGSLDGSARLPAKLAAHIGAQIANALTALHTKGIVHCDVKPHNVVITEDGVAKLADFGAAYRIDSSTTNTPSGPFSLTPAYAAPEAFRGAPERASDLFSLGATVYALVTGEPPPRGPGRAIRTEALGDLVEDGPLREVLTAMLQREPGRRPGAEEAQRALREVAGPVELLPEVSFDEVTKPYPPPDEPGERDAVGTDRRPSLVRRRPLLTGGAAATVVAIAVVATVLGLNDGDAGGSSAHADEAPTNQPTATPTATRTGGFGLGDPRTVDPCALLETTVFERYGHYAQLDPRYGNYDRCDVVLSSDENEIVDVSVDLNTDDPPSTTAAGAKTSGKVTVVPDDPESEQCGRTLALSGVRDTVIRLTAKLIDDAKAPLCDIADAAVEHAVTVLNRGEVPRRSPKLPADSLSQQDACGLLDARALEVVPGIDARDPDVGFGRWTCDWESTTNRMTARLAFDQGILSPPDNSRFTELAGHDAVVMPEYEGDGTCTVDVFYHPHQSHDDGPTERLRLEVGGARAQDRPCETATDLARSATAALPAI
ncbi:serine/threonine-protein kinase [Streptomyces sp. ME19-01-6]|uniref:serine/threonine-protein kinase n=1 Tax=Streptomyces sp. ME19-01-6 TaxID=3028686 RepID=UPI0029AA12DB|nr:protein kinase [Streptomyces sp. ME19-01-6]MDX3230511.1 protein kinase [Streptomyces sp. ME19-01-6]